ncbi:hypothetical protein [Streptomyces sp. NPDC052701]|uniref:hypothetical protein n=1 Tax=Streptomyces sp. NPDC052701 TaxID=3155533 RepID=UPI00341496E8
MTVHVSDRPTTAASGRSADSSPTHAARPRPPREQNPSPWQAEHLRALNRRQLQDRVRDVGDLYTQTRGSAPWELDRDRGGFLRRLAADVRRPGFALLVAQTTVLTGCAYGFPVGDRGPWWRGLDEHLPGDLARLAAAGRLFAVAETLVEPGARARHGNGDWNLARRLHTRLLADHGAAAGVTLVNRTDTGTLAALRSWGWRQAAAEVRDAPLPASPWHALVLRP